MKNFGLASTEKKPWLVKVVHARVRGRCRYKVRGLCGSVALKRYLELRLSAARGIDYVRANAVTGNVLLRFQAQRSPRAMAAVIESAVKEYILNPELATKQLNQRTAESASHSISEPWHLKDAGAIATELETSVERGLSKEARVANLRRYGANVLASSEPRSGVSIFIDYFKSVPVALLSAAAGLSLLTGGGSRRDGHHGSGDH